MSMTAGMLPALWTPSRSRFGSWWRRPAREAVAWMADHLKYGTGNHLLYGPDGHLVYDCEPPPGDPPVTCTDVDIAVATFSGVTRVCVQDGSNSLFFTDDPNITTTFTYNTTGTFFGQTWRQYLAPTIDLNFYESTTTCEGEPFSPPDVFDQILYIRCTDTSVIFIFACGHFGTDVVTPESILLEDIAEPQTFSNGYTTAMSGGYGYGGSVTFTLYDT